MNVMESDKTETGMNVQGEIKDSPYSLLIVDDERLVRLVMKRRLASLHLRVLEAENGKEALEILQRETVDLIVSDWMMPELDGLGLCQAVKGSDYFKSIQFILMTALDQPQQLAEGLACGADDFLLKSATDQEILARIGAGLRSRQLRIELEEAYRLIAEKQREFDAEIQSASGFVRTLLPVSGEVVPGIQLGWEFLPSALLGGDLFQVAQWGEDYLGIMVLDMSGHGIGPALRAVSLSMQFKREHIASYFPGFDPGEIVTRLNTENPMTDQGEYFTVWVGVLQLSTNVLRYASGGHPGGLLIRKEGPSVSLGGKTWPVGFSPDETYETHSITLTQGDRLYVFSDGIYEVINAEEEIWGTSRLQETMEGVYKKSLRLGLKHIMQASRSWQADGIFGDDVALVGVEMT